MRSSAILRAIRSTCAGPSSCVTPTIASSPGRSIEPTTSPSTSTSARVTRWSTALITTSPRAPRRSEADGDHGAHGLAVPEHGLVVEDLEQSVVADTDPAQDRSEQHAASPGRPVGHLQGDATPVGETDGVDGLRAVLGDEPVNGADEGGDVPMGATEVLREVTDGPRDPRLGSCRRCGEAAEGARQTAERHGVDRGAAAVD